MNRAWPWAKSSPWYTGRRENPPGLVAATAGAPAVHGAAAPAIAAIHQERPSLRMGGSLTFGAAKIERTRRLSYPRVGAGHPRRSRRPARADGRGWQHAAHGGGSLPRYAVLARLHHHARRPSTWKIGSGAAVSVPATGGRRAYHSYLAAPGGAAALAVTRRARPPGRAGHGDRARGHRGCAARADRVGPALGADAARDLHGAGQPAGLRLGQGPRPARGGRAQ